MPAVDFNQALFSKTVPHKLVLLRKDLSKQTFDPDYQLTPRSTTPRSGYDTMGISGDRVSNKRSTGAAGDDSGSRSQFLGDSNAIFQGSFLDFLSANNSDDSKLVPKFMPLCNTVDSRIVDNFEVMHF